MPRPPESVLTALRIVARAGSVIAEALVTIAIQLKRPGQDEREAIWNEAWRGGLRNWLDAIGAGSPDWDKEVTYPKSSHSVGIDDAIDSDEFERRWAARHGHYRGYHPALED